MDSPKLHLYSTAGRSFERCRKIAPSNKEQRQKMYQSCDLTKNKPSLPTSGQKKFSPFNTVSRNCRDSYLLRVTKQANTQSNYLVNPEPTMKKTPTPTIDRAKFKRIIGPVQDTDFSIKLDQKTRDKRCTSACLPSETKRPLTARQTHNWRKKHEHLDFNKQIDPERILQNTARNANKTLSKSKDNYTSESQNFVQIQQIRNTTESNFNNYKRFSLQVKTERSHAFNSDSGHQYLKPTKTNANEYPTHDIFNSNQGYFRKSFAKPKGEMRFQLFREQIKTRNDRNDPSWAQALEYEPDYQSTQPSVRNYINFKQVSSRRMNQVHNKYPIRQTLKPFVPMNRFK